MSVIQYHRVPPGAFIDRHHYRGGTIFKSTADTCDIFDIEQHLVGQADHDTRTGFLQRGETTINGGHLAIAKRLVVDGAQSQAPQHVTGDVLFVPYHRHQFHQVTAAEHFRGAPEQGLAADGQCEFVDAAHPL